MITLPLSHHDITQADITVVYMALMERCSDGWEMQVLTSHQIDQ